MKKKMSKMIDSKEAKMVRISSPKALPLELCKDGHICLWDAEGKYKWTIAYFDFDKEGPDLIFIGERPMDARVDWVVFRQLIKLGFAVAQHEFEFSLDKE